MDDQKANVEQYVRALMTKHDGELRAGGNRAEKAFDDMFGVIGARDPKLLDHFLRQVTKIVPPELGAKFVMQCSMAYDDVKVAGREGVQRGMNRPKIFSEYEARIMGAFGQALHEEIAELKQELPWWKRIFK